MDIDFNPADTFVISPLDPASIEAGVCFSAYFDELQTLLEAGFDPEKSVSAHPEDLTPPNGLLLVARSFGIAMGCGAIKIVRDSSLTYGEIKRMWVAKEARGLQVGQRLLTGLEAFARQCGLQTVRLDTHHALKAARALYEKNGYVEIAPYNDNPYAQHWYEKSL